MKCAECRHLDLSTKLNRRWAAVGYAVCAAGMTPTKCGCPTLQQWPLYLHHDCPKKSQLSGANKNEQLEKLKYFRDFLEGKMRRN